VKIHRRPLKLIKQYVGLVGLMKFVMNTRYCITPKKLLKE